jgi:hypothetical protein
MRLLGSKHVAIATWDSTLLFLRDLSELTFLSEQPAGGVLLENSDLDNIHWPLKIKPKQSLTKNHGWMNGLSFFLKAQAQWPGPY